MRTCKTCRKYKGCLEGDREYPCRDWERRDKHDKRYDGNNPAATGTQPDPAASRTAADHRPRTSQDHPAQAGAAGQMHLCDMCSDLRLAWAVCWILRSVSVFYVGTGGDLMTVREWAVVTLVTVGIFAGLFAGAFWTAA